jgi:peptidoglycan/LPS O-acetylase OafA/YrhL
MSRHRDGQPDVGSTRIDPRYRSLDGLRGVAAVGVVLYHVDWVNHLSGTQFVRNGFLFVDLFFILSGFLLASVYRTRLSSSAELRSFLLLRFFRIYPLHLAILAAFVAIELGKLSLMQYGLAAPSGTAFGGGRSLEALPYNALLLQGAGFVNRFTWNVPSWSISSEAVAYLVFGVVSVSMSFRAKWLSCCVVTALAAYAALIVQHGTLDVNPSLGLVRCLSGFCIGAALSRLPASQRAAAPLSSFSTPVALGILTALAAVHALLVGLIAAVVGLSALTYRVVEAPARLYGRALAARIDKGALLGAEGARAR